MPVGDSLATKIRDWRENRSLPFATELLGAAFILGRKEEALDAAEFILSQGHRASTPATALAFKVLNLEDETSSTEVLITESLEHIYQRIHDIRERLRDEPRNSLLWTDLAHEYATLGHLPQAERAIEIAYRLTPENRFVLRCAARFLLHQGDFQRAHQLLLTAQSTPHDPWLLAAEIAVASVAKRSPKFAKQGVRIIAAGSYSPSHLTELASALATLELEHGHSKGARRLFRQALTNPTENTVAQAGWASRHLDGFELSTVYLQTPRSFEARAWTYRAGGEWERALYEAQQWLYDQPFSSRPAQLASYVAAVALEDYATSERILQMGLIASPTDRILLNNLAFALANLGRVEEAQKVFDKIPLGNLSGHERVVWLATNGLLQYRHGFPHEGRLYYLQAIELAENQSNQRLAALAALFYAREALLSNTDTARLAMKLAREMAEDNSDPDVEVLLKRFSRMAESTRRATPHRR